MHSFALKPLALTQRITLLLFIVSLTAFAAHSQEPKTPRLAELTVTVNDERGDPIADAAVTAYGMGFEEGTGKGMWDSDALGPPTAQRTNDQGQVVVKYPVNVPFQKMMLTTNSVLLSVSHYDYVQKTIEKRLENQPTEVTLKRGCDIQLSAVDQNQQAVTEFAVMMAGPYTPKHWIDNDTGGRRTGAASDGNWQTMIVKPQPDGATLFSGVLRLRVRPSQAVRVQNVRIKPGTQVTGKLSDNVPRPVKNGYVVTTTVPKPAGESSSPDNPSLRWQQTSPISEDGTFELKSIPSSGKLQVIAFCDGWLAKTVPAEKFHVRGQLFDVTKDKMNVTVDMEETGTLEVTVTKPDGKPLSSGTLSSWPLQLLYKGPEMSLGQTGDTMQEVTNQLLPIEKQVMHLEAENTDLPFANQPVQNGKAILRGLPIHRPNLFELEHETYTLKSNVVRFAIESAEPKKLSVDTK